MYFKSKEESKDIFRVEFQDNCGRISISRVSKKERDELKRNFEASKKHINKVDVVRHDRTSVTLPKQAVNHINVHFNSLDSKSSYIIEGFNCILKNEKNEQVEFYDSCGNLVKETFVGRFFICHNFLVPSFDKDSFFNVRTIKVNEEYSLIVAIPEIKLRDRRIVSHVEVKKCFKEVSFKQAKEMFPKLDGFGYARTEIVLEHIAASKSKEVTFSPVMRMNEVAKKMQKEVEEIGKIKVEKLPAMQMKTREIMKVKSQKTQSVFNTIKKLHGMIDGRIDKSIRLQNSLKTKGVFSEFWS